MAGVTAARTVVAQLTDPHVTAAGSLLFDKVDTAGFLQAAVGHLNGLTPRPDLVVATGDLTNEGKPAEYERLAELLGQLTMPFVILPGNHDDLVAMREVFDPPPDVGDALGWHHVTEVGPLRVVGLDSLVPGQPGGRLGPERLAWLDGVLGSSDAPTIIAVHHPPHVTGIDHMDGMRLEDGDALGEVVERHPHVARVITGHIHRAITALWHGTVVTTSPGTAHQVVLDLDDGPARWSLEPPAVQLHVWLPEVASLVTHTSYIGDFGPTEPFD